MKNKIIKLETLFEYPENAIALNNLDTLLEKIRNSGAALVAFSVSHYYTTVYDMLDVGYIDSLGFFQKLKVKICTKYTELIFNNPSSWTPKLNENEYLLSDLVYPFKYIIFFKKPDIGSSISTVYFKYNTFTASIRLRNEDKLAVIDNLFGSDLTARYNKLLEESKNIVNNILFCKMEQNTQSISINRVVWDSKPMALYRDGNKPFNKEIQLRVLKFVNNADFSYAGKYYLDRKLFEHIANITSDSEIVTITFQYKTIGKDERFSIFLDNDDFERFKSDFIQTVGEEKAMPILVESMLGGKYVKIYIDIFSSTNCKRNSFYNQVNSDSEWRKSFSINF